MSRTRRLQKRANRGQWLMARVATNDMRLVGYSIELIDWKQPLRSSLRQPFWRGCPIASLKPVLAKAQRQAPAPSAQA